MAHDILIVDDEIDIRNLISGILKDEGYETRTAADGRQALEEINYRCPGLIILDVWLNDTRYDGISLLDILQQEHPDVPIIMISGHGTIETAVAAIKKGAYDFIEKPFKSDRLLLVIKRALEATFLRKENKELRLRSSDVGVFAGQSPALMQLKQWIQKNASSNSRIWLQGEVGTAKETIAREIHFLSHRNQGPVIVVNCQNEEKLEEEIFGIQNVHAWKNTESKIGKLEKAHKGTLILSEINNMPLKVQQRLLKFIQDKVFTRDNNGQKVSVDVRIIVTCSDNIEKLIAERSFIEDLYVRLAIVSYKVPSLHQRREDIPEIVSYFIEQSLANTLLKPMIFSKDTLVLLQSYDWPGNLAQLRNTIDWALIVASCRQVSIITAEMLPPEVIGKKLDESSYHYLQGIVCFPLREARELFERYYLTLQVNRFNKNISQTAQFIGMERSALHRKLKSLGIYCEKEPINAKVA